MQGYVLAFRPATGDGTIVTDSGEAIRFTGTNCHTELYGGDIVTFDVGSGEALDGDTGARDIEVVQKWSDRLTRDTACQGQLRELYATLQMDEPVQ